MVSQLWGTKVVTAAEEDIAKIKIDADSMSDDVREILKRSGNATLRAMADDDPEVATRAAQKAARGYWGLPDPDA